MPYVEEQAQIPMNQAQHCQMPQLQNESQDQQERTTGASGGVAKPRQLQNGSQERLSLWRTEKEALLCGVSGQ